MPSVREILNWAAVHRQPGMGCYKSEWPGAASAYAGGHISPQSSPEYGHNLSSSPLFLGSDFSPGIVDKSGKMTRPLPWKASNPIVMQMRAAQYNSTVGKNFQIGPGKTGDISSLTFPRHVCTHMAYYTAHSSGGDRVQFRVP